ncbi:MAG: IS1595 family transposase [Alphaproteobacteria bacterium]
MAKAMTISQFFKRFPDDDACLDHLMNVRYGMKWDCPKCGKATNWSRIRKEPAYQCQWCGHHIHPMAGTPFQSTRTSLQKWFYAMFLFTTTRNGVAAKELQRQLGVTYKCAWRMGHEIRKYLAYVDGDAPLGGSGIVEADETFIGGHAPQDRALENKSIVLGMVERGGEIVARVVRTRSIHDMVPLILTHVKRGTRIMTDEHQTYTALTEEGYRHEFVTHVAKEWVRGDVHTNTLEGFWAALKRAINGTHIWVSRKHLDKYLGEFEFRYNLRKQPHLMFDLLLAAFPRG